MKKSKLAHTIAVSVWNTFARKKNKNVPYYSAVNLEKAIEEGIKQHVDAEISSAEFAKRGVYEISYLDVGHNQFRVKMFDELPMAVEWMRYMEFIKHAESKFKYVACNFQDEFDACNDVPF
jgi:hypothetical protein